MRMRIMIIIGTSGRTITGGMRRTMRIRMAGRVLGGRSGMRRPRGMRVMRIGGGRMGMILSGRRIKKAREIKTKKKVMEMMKNNNNTKLYK